MFIYIANLSFGPLPFIDYFLIIDLPIILWVVGTVIVW